MTTQISKTSVSALAGLILTLPAVLFIFISVMKYAFGVSVFFNGAQPVLESLGINESPGWNINLLIVFGPLLALLLNVSSVLSFTYQLAKEDMIFHFYVKKKTLNWSVIFLSGLCLTTLFVYLLGENCNCH